MSAKMTIRPTHPVQCWRNIWKPLLLYFWQSSCRLGNCMSVWTQYENFNFIPAKKAIFKGQKMTSFPEIKSCYTKQIKTYSFVQSILTDAPEKNQFLRTQWVIKTCHEWVQNLFKIELQVYSCDFAWYFLNNIF